MIGCFVNKINVLLFPSIFGLLGGRPAKRPPKRSILADSFAIILRSFLGFLYTVAAPRDSSKLRFCYFFVILFNNKT